MVYNDKGCKSIRAGILDCFASLAMTNQRGGRRDERKITLTRSLVYLSTRLLKTQPCSSLRGTKQSMIMNHKRAYNDKGCKSIRVGILDCFATLAMTNEREGRKGEGMKGRKDERAKGRPQQATGNKQQAGKPRRAKGQKANVRKENNANSSTRLLVYSSTENTTLSSLRGTKQSMIMKDKMAYNDKGCRIYTCTAKIFPSHNFNPCEV
ncbi:MAG: hypothetical protein LBL13_01310 [Bacteroidales bacterium]|nr:hypothetical protein [Bacteroidales bacterium]